MCREFNWSTVLDRHLQRQVQALRVFCHYKTSECEWQGEIIGLLPHVLADHEVSVNQYNISKAFGPGLVCTKIQDNYGIVEQIKMYET